MSKTILLTGGAGYIGAHTALELLSQGHDVVLMDNFSNSDVSVIGKIEHLAGRSIKCEIGDVRDTHKVVSVMARHNVDAVIHLAGLKSVSESILEPLDYFDINLSGSISVCKAMRECGVETLVFSSSATVYGEPAYLPIDESHEIRPLNPYGRSKAQVEQVLFDLCLEVCHQDGVRRAAGGLLRLACLRYFNPVGAHASGIIGDVSNDKPNNLFPILSRVASKKDAALQVYGDNYDTPDGSGIRDYIHVVDVARGHSQVLDFMDANPGRYTFNLGTGLGYSVFEVVRAFEIASGRPIPTKIAPRRPGDVGSCYADAGKAERAFGWKASMSLAEMCESAWRFEILRN